MKHIIGALLLTLVTTSFLPSKNIVSSKTCGLVSTSSKYETYHLIDSAQYHMKQVLMKLGFNSTNASVIARDFEKEITPYFDGFFWKKANVIYVVTDYRYRYFDATITDDVKEEESKGRANVIYYKESDLNPIKGKFLQITFYTNDPSIIYSHIMLGNDDEGFLGKDVVFDSFKIGYVKYD